MAHGFLSQCLMVSPRALTRSGDSRVSVCAHVVQSPGAVCEGPLSTCKGPWSAAPAAITQPVCPSIPGWGQVTARPGECAALGGGPSSGHVWSSERLGRRGEALLRGLSCGSMKATAKPVEVGPVHLPPHPDSSRRCTGPNGRSQGHLGIWD